MSTETTPQDFMARMVERHSRAFDLWRRTHERLEVAVPTARDLSSPFSRALDILFIQAFKSHGSLYVLCVRGQGEDAGTILRRMLEIAIQVRYLSVEAAPAERDTRGRRYLAYYWLQVPELVKDGLCADTHRWWLTHYNAYKNLVCDERGRPFRNWWGNSSIRDLASSLGLMATYDEDYRFLSQMAHCTAQGILFAQRGEIVEIRTDLLVREILVFGTRYIIGIAQPWNEHFGL
jgi:hypothetical protein